MSLFRFLKPLVERFPRLASFYRHLRDTKSLRGDVLFREPLGFYFNGSDSMERGDFEETETRIVDSILSSFDSLVNVGANSGYYVCKALNKGTSVLAFEPNQLNVNILLRNVYANQFTAKAIIFPFALGDETGILPLYGDSTGASLIEGWAGQKTSNLVPVSTFDEVAYPLVRDKKSFVLVDIEGAELSFLRGAHKLLSSSTDNAFMIEISVAEHQPEGTEINPHLLETFRLMNSYGYIAFTADAALRQVDIAEVSQIATTTRDSLGTHNFLFLKDPSILNSIEF